MLESVGKDVGLEEETALSVNFFLEGRQSIEIGLGKILLLQLLFGIHFVLSVNAAVHQIDYLGEELVLVNELLYYLSFEMSLVWLVVGDDLSLVPEMDGL